MVENDHTCLGPDVTVGFNNNYLVFMANCQYFDIPIMSVVQIEEGRAFAEIPVYPIDEEEIRDVRDKAVSVMDIRCCLLSETA